MGTVSRLSRGEIIDVYVRADSDPSPPGYLEVPVKGEESCKSRSRSRSREEENTEKRKSGSGREKDRTARERRSWFGSGNPK